MLVANGAVNSSGNSVTTLIVSIGLVRGDVVIAPSFHDGAGAHPFEPEQPTAVIRPAPRHDQRPRDHAPLGVHDVQARARNEDGTGILDQGDHSHLPLLSVRLAQPPDYPGRFPNTPGFLSSERTVSVRSAPFASHACTCSPFTLITPGSAAGLLWLP